MWNWSVAAVSTGAVRLAAALRFMMHSAQVAPSLPVRGWMNSSAGFVLLQELQYFVSAIVLGGAPGCWAAPISLSGIRTIPQVSGATGLQRPSSGTNRASPRRIGTS